MAMGRWRAGFAVVALMLAASRPVAGLAEGPFATAQTDPTPAAAAPEEPGSSLGESAGEAVEELAEAAPSQRAQAPMQVEADPPADEDAAAAGLPLAEAPAEPAAVGDQMPAAQASAPAVRCLVRLDVAGELVAPAGRDVPPVRLPIELEARFDYIETADSATAAAVSRRYHDAVASMRVGDDVARRVLAADARTVLVARKAGRSMPYLENAFLTGDEHDLLDVPFDSLLLDGLVPETAVAVGATWEIPADLAAGLLAIDTVDSGGIEARLEEVVAGRGRVTLTGTVAGGVDGAPTRVDVSGSFAAPAREADRSIADDANDEVADPQGRLHELQPRVDHVSIVMRERRQAGHVAPGFDVEARLVVARGPARAGGGPQPEPATEGGATGRRRGAGMPARVWHRDADGRFDVVHDVRWRPVQDAPTGLVMRFVDHGALVGQCSITATAAVGNDAVSLAEVRQDIERSLSGQIERVDEAAGEDREDGVRVVRVASSGMAEGLPFRWIHYVLAAPTGDRVDVAFMVQESMRERFAAADRDLIAGLMVPAGGGPAVEPAGVRQARGPGVATPSESGPR